MDVLVRQVSLPCRSHRTIHQVLQNENNKKIFYCVMSFYTRGARKSQVYLIKVLLSNFNIAIIIISNFLRYLCINHKNL